MDYQQAVLCVLHTFPEDAAIKWGNMRLFICHKKQERLLQVGDINLLLSASDNSQILIAIGDLRKPSESDVTSL